MGINAKEVGARLKKLRGTRSIIEVAKDLNISNSALCMYENGERSPRDCIKIRIANYYGQKIGTLFFNENAHNE